MSKISTKKTLEETVKLLIMQHLNTYSDVECASILRGLKILVDYDISVDRNQSVVSLEQFQNILSKINEDFCGYYADEWATENIEINN